MLKTTLSERDGNTVKFEVEVSEAELQEAFDAKLKKLSREIRIPGFRPGKAPMAMIRQRFGDEAIITDAVEDAMSGWFTTAALQLDLDPVERPQIDIGEELPELGKPLVFTATVTVMPEVELGEYKGLEVPKESIEAKDEEVDAQVERLRNEFAELKPVTDRPVKTGDFVTADFRATLDGEAVEALEANDFAFEAGAGRLFAEIEVNTLGLKPDEEKTFALTLPEEAGEEVGGKTVDFTVNIKEIKEKVLPKLSDSWASEVSEFGTLLELRQEIRSKIQGAKEYSVGQRFRAEAAQAASDNAKLDMPDVIITEQAQEMVGDFARSLAQQGGDIRAYMEATGVTVEQMVEDFKPQAARNVKTGLVLDAVAKAEGLEVTEAEVDDAVAQMAAASRTDAAKLKKDLQKNGRLAPVGWQILRDKAADFIAENAVAVEPPAAPAEKEEAKPKAKPKTKAAKEEPAAEKAEKAPKTGQAAEKPAAKNTAAKKPATQKTEKAAAAKPAAKKAADKAGEAPKAAPRKPAAKSTKKTESE